MNKIHRFLTISALSLLLPCSAFAQDARQRTPVTIVADVMAEIPYSNHADFDNAMNDLLGTGSFAVTQLASQLLPAAQGQNSRVEYALDGLVNYTSANATPEQRAAVCEGLASAFASCSDTPNRVFLLSLLSRVSRPDDAKVFVDAITDPELTEIAQSGLILTPGTDELVATMVAEGKLPLTVLARLAGAKKLSQCESVLTDRLKTADSQEATAIYKALALIGTTKSIPTLAKAAAKENYSGFPTDATPSYVELLNRLSNDPASKKNVAAAASKLMNKKIDSHVRSGALTALFNARGTDAAPALYKALRDNDRQYRVAALRASTPWCNPQIIKNVAAIALNDKTPSTTKTDIINWIGANKFNAPAEVIVSNIASTDDELAEASIRAAGRLGGQPMLDILVAQLDGPHSDAALNALLAFNGKVDDTVLAALSNPESSAPTTVNSLIIASERRLKAASPIAMQLLDSNDTIISNAAYNSLPGVVSPTDLKTISSRLEKAAPHRVAPLKDALLSALMQLPANQRYDAINELMGAGSNPTLYYSAMAATATPQAISTLTDAYNQPATSAAALEALLQIDSPDVMETLFEIAKTDDAANPAVLERYALLASHYVDNPVERYQNYRRAIMASKSAELDNKLLSLLAETGTYPALMIANKYVAIPANSMAAATAIRSIMSKHIDEFSGDEVRDALVKAADIFKADKDNADSGYAVDDINSMLAKLDAKAKTPRSSQLTEQEKAEGFEMLFDGTSLSKWTGDTVTYIVRDGCITINAARWGNNIYTIDQYDDFVLRFEFALDRPGVNNGVGIRTPMNVDAAFHGMEIQILDHDDPMYADLQPYQVHGSVYGVIPAKRAKFTHGQWNTEEIRAEGDHITVTVNGEVILDGNIREACQGHNVGDPGEEGNHYMIDHRNHPGLFNKSGHIGFLGHGDGLRIRNVRVREL